MSVGTRVMLLCAAFLWAPLVVAESPKPGVEPRVDQLLRNMSEFLRAADEFSFRTEVNYDEFLETGQKILYSRRSEIAMRRPNRLHVLVNGDLINERIWYDGETVALLDLWDYDYVKIKVPPKLDDALDFLAKEYGIASPVADVLYADPYAILIENVVTGIHIGRSVVRGVPAHHLAFTQSNIDWQLWIEDGAHPVPVKAVITYKNVKGSPQFVVWLSDWNFAPRLADSMFEFVPPRGAVQVEIEPITQ